MRKHFIYTLWGIFATFIVSAMLAFFAIWKRMLSALHIPAVPENPISRFATQVYSSDGKVSVTWNREQGEPYRDTLQEDVTLFNKGTGCHGG